MCGDQQQQLDEQDIAITELQQQLADVQAAAAAATSELSHLKIQSALDNRDEDIADLQKEVAQQATDLQQEKCDSELLLGWIVGLQSDLDDTEAAAAGTKQQLDGALNELAEERQRLVEVAAKLQQVGCCC
jgi:chromosome segregation ATPase